MAAADICRGQTLVYLQRRSEATTRPGQTHWAQFLAVLPINRRSANNNLAE